MGSIDPETQEAAWHFKNKDDAPTFSTGAYNLTQQETNAQMTFPDGATKKLLLVRINRNA